jgi:uncharacterized protein (DUF2164 family)
LITFYNQAIEDAARAAEKVLRSSDAVLAGTVIRRLAILD